MYNKSIIDAAEEVAKATQKDFFSIAHEGAVVLSAVAGAGKSWFVTDTVKKCRQRELRVAVAAPTNEQVFSLVRSIASNEPTQPVAYVPAQDVELPPWAQLPNVSTFTPAHLASDQPVLVGTIDKLASARNPRNPKVVGALKAFDALIIDESFQANAGRYFAIGDIAPRHLTVGDSGQIKPFTILPAGQQWKGLAEDPLQTAVSVLRINHPATPTHQFPITRRLDGRAVAIARHFYAADHEFGAAVADGVRQMTLGPAKAVSARDKALDQGLDLAAHSGWAYLELPAYQTLVADPDTARLIADLLVRLRSRGAKLLCERHPNGVGLVAERVAVAVSHNDQKSMVRAMLDHAGLAGVVVNTANKLQGLEFDFVVGWHPMAGLDEPDEFHLESGRMCVMCTRHRHACVIVGRAGDRQLVQGLPPSTPAWPGADVEDDEVLRGWQVHRDVFAALQPYLVVIP